MTDETAAFPTPAVADAPIVSVSPDKIVLIGGALRSAADVEAFCQRLFALADVVFPEPEPEPRARKAHKNKGQPQGVRPIKNALPCSTARAIVDAVKDLGPDADPKKIAEHLGIES